MKRYIFIALAIFSLLLAVSGCQFLNREQTQSQEAVVDDVKIEKFTGVLSPLTDSNLNATHILKTDDGQEINLRSGILHLQKYEKRRIDIEAKKDADGIYEAESATRIGREDDARESYANSRLGFSTQVNPLWVVAEKNEEILFTPYAVSDQDVVDRITFSRTSNEKQLAPEKWLDLDENLNSKDIKDDAFYTKVIVGLDQLAGIKRTSKDGTRIDIYLSHESFMYRLSHATIKDEDADTYRTLFFDMVNSFRLLVAGESVSSATENASSTASSASVAPPAKPIVPPAPKPAPEAAKGVSRTPETPSEPVVTAPSPEPSAPPAATTVSEVKDGYELMQSSRWKIEMQYPKNWHWTRWETGYAFGEKEVNSVEDIVMTLNRSDAMNQPGEDGVSCKKLQENEIYCLIWVDHYGPPADDVFMLSTLRKL